MIYRILGSTGERFSAIGVGGWHLSLKHVDEKLAIRIVRSAIDGGINRRCCATSRQSQTISNRSKKEHK